MLPTLFNICTPRPDIQKGSTAESDFAADLAQVLQGTAPYEYGNASAFFTNTYPTRGLCNLLDNVCRRLSGKGGQVASIFRLDTNYGGGKTHALIALAHVATKGRTVSNIAEFIDPDNIPSTSVRIAAFDGENSDPINGHAVGDGILTHTPWGELAYILGGVTGYQRVEKSDIEGVTPGADTLKELLGDQPTLILLDELSIYLRKQGARDLKFAAKQLTGFLTALFKAVESSPRVALVYTLAIGKEDKIATDAYSTENQIIADMMQEAESISARKATLLDPTEEDETIKVLRRRLFAYVDVSGAKQVVDAYAQLWERYKDELPSFGINDFRRDEFYAGFPLHPELISTLKEKTSTLGNFQRVRGMLRFLAQTISRLWAEQPANTYAVHLHHIDLRYSPIRQEVVTKLGQSAFVPALKADIAAAEGDTPSLAETIDARDYSGLAPYASYVARTIFFHTLAFNDALQGADKQEIFYSVLAPDLDLGLIADAIRRFRDESAYLDDNPQRALRFLVEPNLTQIIQHKARQIDPQDIRSSLNDQIRQIFRTDLFQSVFFPALPQDLEDKAEKPLLAVMGYEATAVASNNTSLNIPDLISRLFLNASDKSPRLNRNNLVFLVVDEDKVATMKAEMRLCLAIESIRNSSQATELPDHQKRKLEERYARSKQEVAIAIQQAYRHLFYPSKMRLPRASVDLAHIAIDVQNASANPGVGQKQIVRVLQDANKLPQGDVCSSPAFLIAKTPLSSGQISTQELYNEYSQNLEFPILPTRDIFMRTIREGIITKAFVYKKDSLICGLGDPYPTIEISNQAFVLTCQYAQDNKIWPQEKTDPLPPPPPPPPSIPTLIVTPEKEEVSQVEEEGVLREALTHIVEDARAKKFNSFKEFKLTTYNADDGISLSIAIAKIPSCEKQVQLECSLETTDGSSFDVDFTGSLGAFAPIRDFLRPQIRAAKKSDCSLTITFVFQDSGLSLTDQSAIDAFRSKLEAIAGSAVVKLSVTNGGDSHD